MNDVIYRGIKVSTDCKYFQFIPSDEAKVVEDQVISLYKVEYVSGESSLVTAKKLGLEHVGQEELDILPMPLPKKFTTPILTINGVKFRKLTYDTHIIHILLVKDQGSKVSQNYQSTTIVVSEADSVDSDFINYLFYSGNLMYLAPVGPRDESLVRLYNFPKITVKNSDLCLNSSSTLSHNLRRRYDDYLIRAVDYQEQFIKEVGNILGNYGLELVRINKETTLRSTSHITYQFLQTPMRASHPKYSDSEVLHHKVPVEFNFHCTDMVMFFDFKNKYSNLNLLTNFCEFKTTDMEGNRWSSCIRWSGVTDEFNHTYQQDSNANFSYQCQFRCEIWFYEVLDGRYDYISEIVSNLGTL